jgi:hypothetical protein
MAEDPPKTTRQPPPLHIHRPIPRRALDTTSYQDAADSPTHAFSQATPPSANDSRRSSDFLAQLNARLLRTYNSRNEDTEEQERLPPRNKSLLNMTSSTLSGIYDEVGSGTAGEPSLVDTPWGTGAETPAHSGMGIHAWETGMGSPDAGLSMKNQARSRSANNKVDPRTKGHSIKAPRQGLLKYAVIASKLSALYIFGIIYGLIVSHLHETRQLAAVHVDGVDRSSRVYLASWGAFGVALGSLLPYVDLVWGGRRVNKASGDKDADSPESPISEQINDVVRSVCAFVGIAFAIVSVNQLCTSAVSLLTCIIAPSSMAIHAATYTYACTCQPSVVVYSRPFKTRTIFVAHRNFHRHVLHLPLQSRRSSFTAATGDHQRDTDSPRWYWCVQG